MSGDIYELQTFQAKRFFRIFCSDIDFTSPVNYQVDACYRKNITDWRFKAYLKPLWSAKKHADAESLAIVN